jgi:hypothetical protein
MFPKLALGFIPVILRHNDIFLKFAGSIFTPKEKTTGLLLWTFISIISLHSENNPHRENNVTKT